MDGISSLPPVFSNKPIYYGSCYEALYHIPSFPGLVSPSKVQTKEEKAALNLLEDDKKPILSNHVMFLYDSLYLLNYMWWGWVTEWGDRWVPSISFHRWRLIHLCHICQTILSDKPPADCLFWRLFRRNSTQPMHPSFYHKTKKGVFASLIKHRREP